MGSSFPRTVRHIEVDQFPAGFVAWMPVSPEDINDYLDYLDPKGWFLCNGSYIRGITRGKYPEFVSLFSASLVLEDGSTDQYKFKTPDLKSRTLVGMDTTMTGTITPGSSTGGGSLPKIVGTFPTYDRGQFQSVYNSRVTGAFSVKSLYNTPAEHKHNGANAAVIELDTSRMAGSIYTGDSGTGADMKLIPNGLYAYAFIHLC